MKKSKEEVKLMLILIGLFGFTVLIPLDTLLRFDAVFVIRLIVLLISAVYLYFGFTFEKAIKKPKRIIYFLYFMLLIYLVVSFFSLYFRPKALVLSKMLLEVAFTIYLTKKIERISKVNSKSHIKRRFS